MTTLIEAMARVLDPEAWHANNWVYEWMPERRDVSKKKAQAALTAVQESGYVVEPARYQPHPGQDVIFARMKDGTVCAGYSGQDEQGGFHPICDVTTAVGALDALVIAAQNSAVESTAQVKALEARLTAAAAMLSALPDTGGE